MWHSSDGAYHAAAAAPALCPPCIGGLIFGTLQHNRLVMRYLPPDCLLELEISNISNPLMLDYLCHRDGRSYSCNKNDYLKDACAQPCCTVARDEYYAGYYLSASDGSDPG